MNFLKKLWQNRKAMRTTITGILVIIGGIIALMNGGNLEGSLAAILTGVGLIFAPDLVTKTQKDNALETSKDAAKDYVKRKGLGRPKKGSNIAKIIAILIVFSFVSSCSIFTCPAYGQNNGTFNKIRAISIEPTSTGVGSDTLNILGVDRWMVNDTTLRDWVGANGSGGGGGSQNLQSVMSNGSTANVGTDIELNTNGFMDLQSDFGANLQAINFYENIMTPIGYDFVEMSNIVFDSLENLYPTIRGKGASGLNVETVRFSGNTMTSVSGGHIYSNSNFSAASNNIRDLGRADIRWKDFYAQGTSFLGRVEIDNIVINDNDITTSSGDLNISPFPASSINFELTPSDGSGFNARASNDIGLPFAPDGEARIFIAFDEDDGGFIDLLAEDGDTQASFFDLKPFEITLNSTGNVKLQGLTYPDTDGTNGQVLQTDGSGALSFATPSGGTIMNGSTPNGVLTYNSAGIASVESGLTFQANQILTVASQSNGSGTLLVGSSAGNNGRIIATSSAGSANMSPSFDNSFANGNGAFFYGSSINSGASFVSLFGTLANTADNGNVPCVKIGAYKGAPTASVFSRPTLAGYNHLTKQWEVAANGTWDYQGNITENAIVKLKQYTFATLPTPQTGMTACITDAAAPTYLAIATGGGAIVAPVFYDGTNWVYH